MGLFWKIFAGVFVLLLVMVAPTFYLISVKQIDDARQNLVEENGLVGHLLAKEMEVSYLEAKWPFGSLNDLANRRNTLFWWVVKEDGTIYLANDAAFMGTDANSYFPQLAAQVGNKASPSDVRRRCLAGGADEELVSLNDRQNYGITVHPLRAGKETWAFWIGFSTQEIAAMRNRAILLNVAIASALLVLLGGVLYVMVRHFMKPIRGLVTGAAIVGAGNLGHRVRIESRDELADLARSFNKMAEDLQGTTVSRDYVDGILRTMSDTLMVLDPDGVIRTVNEAACALLGYSEEELCGKPVDVVLAVPRERLTRDAGELKNYETLYRTRDGREVPVLLSCSVMNDEAGRLVRIVCTARDITERKRVEEALRRSEERFQEVAREAQEWIWECDADGLYTYSSPAVADILGYAPDEVVGRLHFYDLWPYEDRETLKRAAFETFAARGTFHEFANRAVHKSGKTVWLQTSGAPILDRDGRLLGYRGTDIDITERKRAQEALEQANRRLEELATIDELTGLYNRRRFLEMLEAEIERSRRYGAPMALVMADIDQFKSINDTYGHSFGDRVLLEVAKLLRTGARATDAVARYGGDEFMVLMPNTTAEEAVSAAERVRRQMAQRTVSDERQSARVTLSAGIAALSSGGAATGDALVREADEALYAAKHSGRNCTRTWDQITHDHEAQAGANIEAVESLRRQVANLSLQSQEMFIESIESLIRALEARDPYTRSHSEHVTRYAVGIAEAMGLDADQTAVVRRAAMVHDIGKIGVPDAILTKVDPFTADERRTMQQHALIGVRILDQLRFLDREVPIVRHHHERWDGHGYPDAISGEAIPLGARILAVADAFDAITSERVYRRARDVHEALRILIEESGRQFDPNVVDALIQWVRANGDTLGQPQEVATVDVDVPSVWPSPGGTN